MVYKLHYFEGRGAAETIRQIFAVTGQKYEDIRYSREEWLKHKPDMPFHQIPVLEVDGKLLPQSMAIARYLSKKFGISGKTPLDDAMIDALADQFKDYIGEIKTAWLVLLGFNEGDEEQLRKDVLEPAREKHFPIFNKILAKSKSGYLVGDSLTYPDLTLAEHVWFMHEKTPGFFDDYPEVTAHSKKVRSNANLKKWLASRPDSKF